MISENFLEEYDSGNEIENLLFYTPKVVQQIDDSDIIEEIFSKFPKLKEAYKNKEEKEERKAFLEFLQCKQATLSVLDKYNLDVMELLKLCCRHFSYIFSTANYIEKVKKIVEQNGYSERRISED